MSAPFSALLRRLVHRPAAQPEWVARYAWMRLGAAPVAFPPSAFAVTKPITRVIA